MKHKLKWFRIKEKTIGGFTWKTLKHTCQELTIEDTIPKDQLNEEIKEEMVDRKDLHYETTKYVYNFQQF